MKSMNHVFTTLSILLLIMLVGCASTMNETGKKFTCKPGIIKIDQTTKREVLETYGQPSSTEIMGKYEILTYHYGKESLKRGKSVGMGFLRAIPVVGLATLAMDHGTKESDIAKEWQGMEVYVELSTGIVRDYWYHDSELKGHDESEALFLKSHGLSKLGKNEDAIKMLEESISLNPRNHRALNSLAWTLIDLNIDVDKGITYAMRAVEVFPDSPYNNGTLGCGYFKKGDLDNAEKYLKVTIDLFPIYAPQDTRALTHDKAILKTVQERKKAK